MRPYPRSAGALSDRANRNCFRVSGLDQQLSCGVNDRVAQLGAGSARRAVAASFGNCPRRVVSHRPAPQDWLIIKHFRCSDFGKRDAGEAVAEVHQFSVDAAV